MFKSQWLITVSLILATIGFLSGCGPERSLKSVPMELVGEAVVPGMPDVRTWGDVVSETYIESLATAVRDYHAYHKAHPDLPIPKTADILCISGGGDDGAYAAGLLCGWTASGDRPEFRLVTGVSTGALIAPLAFLGPRYDQVLRDAYTTISEKDIVKKRGILALLHRDGMYDTDPLYDLIGTWINEQVIAEIAAEHAKGRRLLVATVNLEAQRPVIWDLGAIASTGHPDAPRLLRTIMLASASIPAAFEPQYLTVEAGGDHYEELHVDGGTMAQVFLYGGGVDMAMIAKRAGQDIQRRPVRLFVIRNARFQPEHQKIEPVFGKIAGRAISTLIKTQGIGDMFRLYLRCRNEGIDFHLTSIPPSFTVPKPKTMFEPGYMKALYQAGFEQGSSESAWVQAPPYLTVDEQASKP